MNQFLKKIICAVGISVAVSLTGTAFAQESRYVMERSDNGFVRLDTFTGELSVCTINEGQLVCRMAADERRVLEEQIDALEEKLTFMALTLEERGIEPQNNLPDEAELDRTFDVMEKLMRRFMGVIEDFDGKTNKQKSEADKT